MKNSIYIKKTALSIILLAVGWLLPLITMQVPEIGNMLCPMHIPIFLCGLILGPWYGMALGFITPITRTLIFGMPMLFPTSICMSFELATYGLISGLIYYLFNKVNNKKVYFNLYSTLIIAMVAGRVVYGIARFFTGLFAQNSFTFYLFLTDSVLNAWPGIIIQLLLIPFIVANIRKISFIKQISFYQE